MLLPPANVVCEGYVFTGVCLSTGGSPGKEAPLQGDPPPRRHPPGRRHPLQADPLGGIPPKRRGPPGPHPGGKLRGISSRQTAKGEIEGDQIQAHTQGGN